MNDMRPIKQIKVEVIKYQTADGVIHDTAAQADNHEMRASGNRRTCLSCGGAGKADVVGDGRDLHTCIVCGGKGYQDRMISEAWK